MQTSLKERQIFSWAPESLDEHGVFSYNVVLQYALQFKPPTMDWAFVMTFTPTLKPTEVEREKKPLLKKEQTPAIPLLRITRRNMKGHVHTKTCTHMSTVISNSPKVETTQMPTD